MKYEGLKSMVQNLFSCKSNQFFSISENNTRKVHFALSLAKAFSTISSLHFPSVLVTAVFLHPLSKPTHYGILLHYWLHRLFLHPPCQWRTEVGVVRLCRQRLVLVRDLGLERQRNWRKQVQQPPKRFYMYRGLTFFHCTQCGNDFKTQRHITRENFDDENLSITMIYFPAKCPKCGNWATNPNTIQQYKVL